jgi:hypothetical protein
MSNMENLDAKLNEKERQRRVYETAMRKLDRRNKLREGEGLTLIYAWDAFGQRTKGKTFIGRLCHAAELFCIGFAFLAPVLLFATYVL